MADANPAVRAAKETANDVRNEVLASPISIAEIVSVLVRRGRPHDVQRTLNVVRGVAEVVPLTDDDFESAGHIHARERTFHRDFSLADALMLAQAKAAGAHLMTTDKPLARNHQGVRAKAL